MIVFNGIIMIVYILLIVFNFIDGVEIIFKK